MLTHKEGPNKSVALFGRSRTQMRRRGFPVLTTTQISSLKPATPLLIQEKRFANQKSSMNMDFFSQFRATEARSSKLAVHYLPKFLWER